MNTEIKYEALLNIQAQLQQWAAHQPEDHYKKNGCKNINTALQDVKKIISDVSNSLLAQEANHPGFYEVDGDVNASLQLGNIN